MRQQYLSDEMAPTSNPKIELALDGWLEAKTEQKNAGEMARTKHSVLILHLQEAGIDAYPYVDPTTGKKKQVVVAREPKAKLVNAPNRVRRDRDEKPERADRVEVFGDATDDKIEKRRVKRSQVKNADAIVDPFAATRSSMSDGLIAEAERAQDAMNVAETPDGDVVPTDKATPKKKRGKKS